MRFLIQGLKGREQYLLVTGEYGTGKTLLCLKLVKAMNQEGKIFPHVFVPTPNLRYVDILKKIASFLEIKIQADQEAILQFDIMSYFERQESIYPFFIIMDDAHDIDAQTLDNLRALSNYSCNGIFPFRLILFAHTSFYHRLKSATLRPLDQRIKRRYQLLTLSPEETKEYIYFRLLNSGAKGSPYFEDAALQRIYEVSQGIPRLINNICDTCLLIGVGEETLRIDVRIVKMAGSYLFEDQATQNNSKMERRSAQQNIQKPDGYSFSSQERATMGQGGYFPGQTGESPTRPSAGEQLDFSNVQGGNDLNQTGQASREEVSRNKPSLFSDSIFSGSKRTQIWIITLVLIGLFVFGFFWHLRDGFSFGALAENGYLPEGAEEMAFVNSSDMYQHQSMTGRAINRPESQNQTEYIQLVPSRSLKLNQIGQKTSDSGDKECKNIKEVKDETELLPLFLDEKDNLGAIAKGSMKPEEKGRKTDKHKFSERKDKLLSLIVSSCRKKNSAINVLEEINSKHGQFSASLGQKKSPDGNVWWVVYFGAFSSEQEAKEAKKELDLGQAMMKRVPYTNQIKVFDQLGQAKELCQQLKQQGLWPHLIEGNGQFRVCLGQAVYKSKAVSTKRTLAAKGYDSQVIKR